MYHGTSAEAAALIEQGGFKASTQGLLGPGVYLSRVADECRQYGATILEVAVSVGKVWRADQRPELMPEGYGTDAPWHDREGFDTAWVPPDCPGDVFEGSELFTGTVAEEDCVWDARRVVVLGRAADDGEESMDAVEWCFDDGAEGTGAAEGVGWVAFSRAQNLFIESHYRVWQRGMGEPRAALAGDGPRSIFGTRGGDRREVFLDRMVERSVRTGSERRIKRCLSRRGAAAMVQAMLRCKAGRRWMGRLKPSVAALQRVYRGHLCRQRVRSASSPLHAELA